MNLIDVIKNNINNKVVNEANKKVLIDNINKIHTTKMGYERIRKNLNIKEDVIIYCNNIIEDKKTNIYKQGKNYYCVKDNIVITINSYSYTIITAHIKKTIR